MADKPFVDPTWPRVVLLVSRYSSFHCRISPDARHRCARAFAERRAHTLRTPVHTQTHSYMHARTHTRRPFSSMSAAQLA
jgi:hypothetical protein